MPWKFAHDGKTYRERDLTLGQAERIEDLLTAATGQTVRWGEIHPIRSAKHANRVAAVMVSEALDRSYDEVLAEVMASNMLAFVEEIADDMDDTADMYVDGNPPEADSTTDGSSGS